VIVEVAVLAGVRAPGGTFSYAAPETAPPEAGSLLRVPFGPRQALGVALGPGAPAPTLRELGTPVHPTPVLRPHQIALARWLAAEYRCALADALRAMLPPALVAQTSGGRRLRTPRGERRERVFALTAEGSAALNGASGSLPRPLGAKQRQALALLAAGARSESELREGGGDPGAAVRLAARGLALASWRVLRRVPPEFRVDDAEERPETLSEAQLRAIEAIAGALGRHEDVLLHGVTASGKTEVYLRAAAEALAQGLGVIVLVPEIVLAPQTLGRFVARFGERVAILHSALSAGERYDEWRRILDGAADIVVGSRSALFAPLGRLGLVVIDEEHESTYKQESDPRYDTLATARALGRLAGAVVVAGSATPRVATYHQTRQGRLRLLELPERAGERVVPTVTIVDLRAELRAGNRGIFSRALQRALVATVRRGEQAMLFLNRRGYATVVMCRACGHVVNCPRCDVPFAWHATLRAELRPPGPLPVGTLLCHRCGLRGREPEVCPNCGSPAIRYLGTGTQRVEEEVRKLVPQARLLRLDRDAVRRSGAHVRLFEEMRSRRAQVIVGTQMIAKGFDLPGVTLVGVVSADTMLHLPDFASAERTFALLTQVLGRSGRGPGGGRGIIQTYVPEHYAVRAAAAQDYVAFARAELAERKRFGYPPFGRLVLLQTTAKREDTVRRRADEQARTLRAAAGPDDEVLGPAPSFAAKVANVYRWQIVLRGEDPTYLLEHVGPEWTIDVDPASLLG
jgi:primosomal protein N' (replication factor Y)